MSAVISVPEASLASSLTVSPVTIVSGTGIALYRCSFVQIRGFSLFPTDQGVSHYLINHNVVSPPGPGSAYQCSGRPCP